MKRFTRTSFIALIAAVAIGLSFYAGCSDDTALGPWQHWARTSGRIYLAPSLTAVFEIRATKLSEVKVDSISVGDSVLYGREDSHPAGYVVRWQENCPDTADCMYRSGDTAVITIWGMGRSSTARIPLLDLWADSPVLLAPIDTIIGATDTFPTFYWAFNPHVERYKVSLLAEYYEDGDWDDVVRSYEGADTSIEIPPEFNDSTCVRVRIGVYAIHGKPPPVMDGTWIGDFCDGYIVSQSNPSAAYVTRETYPHPPSPVTTSQRGPTISLPLQ